MIWHRPDRQQHVVRDWSGAAVTPASV